MHAISLLKKWCERNAVIGHRARLDATLRVVVALLDGGKLALTHLGRHRSGSAFVKHHIKAVDRLTWQPSSSARTTRHLRRPGPHCVVRDSAPAHHCRLGRLRA